jgi:hypothetical protein
MAEPDLQVTMQALASACESLSTDALQALDPALARRLVARARPSVALRLGPLAASVLMEAPTGAVIALRTYEAEAMPAALDAAAAAFVPRMIETLSEADQQRVAWLLRTGRGRLGVLVESFPVTATLLVYAGPEAPVVLARVVTAELRH